MKIKCVEVNSDGSYRYEKGLKKDKETGITKEKSRKIVHGRFQIYDTLGFFGCSFMKALKSMDLLTNEKDASFLQNMKDSRNQFNKHTNEEIRAYCKKECEYLVKLMEKIEGYCIELELEMKRWDGAGAIASAMMRKHGIKEHIEELTGGILEAAQHAFSGGRIELIRYGHIEGEIVEADAIIPLIQKRYKTEIKAAIESSVRERKEVVIKNEVNKLLKKYYVKYYELEGKRYSEKDIKEYVTKELKSDWDQTKDTFTAKYARIVIYDYDVNSAYPTCIRDLPSLKVGNWVLEKSVNSKFACVHVRWDLREKDQKNTVRIFPFFYRKESGMIIYPQKGENWIWLPEYEAYLKHKDKYDGTVEVLEVYNFYPASDVKPFAFVDEYAALRLELKEQNKIDPTKGGAHLVLKLGLNSIYGKTAQQIGWHLDENGEKVLPPFHNLAWGGFITSYCRARVYEAGMYKPDKVVMFATDGLFMLEPLDHLHLSKYLGDWELTVATGFTALQSGVYFSDSGNERSCKTRGFEAGSITEQMILEKWNAGIPQAKYDKDGRLVPNPWVVKGRTRKFVTIRSLLSSHELWDIDEVSNKDYLKYNKVGKKRKEMLDKKNKYRYCCWESIPREQALTPQNTKRDSDWIQDPYNNPKYNAAKMLLPTIPAIDHGYRAGISMSSKYKLLWVEETSNLTEFEKNEKQLTDDSDEYLETSEN
jgi:hypothetical protein